MKQVALFSLSLYQCFISPILRHLLGFAHACRYRQTCSSYAREAIVKEGFARGMYRLLLRIASCHPFAA